jgi:hypothetical protein
MKMPGATQPNLISAYRYWFDSDNANMVKVNLPVAVNPYELIRDIAISGLSAGDHTIHFQFKDTQQAWSSVVTDTFNTDGLQVQEISLNAGWNILSLNVVPADKNLENIFQPIINEGSLKKVMDETGNAMENWGIYGGWQNGIGNMLSTEGYKVNVSTASVLRVKGTVLNYVYAIPLTKGWNIVSYPQTTAYSGMAVVQQLMDRMTLVKVQDEAGNAIEDWGVYGGWQNTIYDFLPGKGYKVKVNAKDTLWIYESYPKSSTIIPEQNVTSHFLPEIEENGIDHMNINLVGLPINVLQVGDEIAVYDGPRCVGALTIMPHHLQNQAIAIVASASDNQGIAGFGEGNPIILKLWDSHNNKEFVLEPEIVKGSSTFHKHETSFASLEKYATTGLDGILGSDLTEIKCYPNPFSDEVTIEINLALDSEVSIEIMNQMGQSVKFISSKQILNSGLHKINWNGRNENNATVSSGIYYLKVNIDGTILHNKIMFNAAN